MKKKIAIIGGGITGCTIANLFKDNGDDVVIYEKENKIGGACSDRWDKKGCCWVSEWGPKLLHFNKKTEEARRFLKSKTSLIPYNHRVICLGDCGFTFWPQCKAYEKLHNLLNPDKSFFTEYINGYSVKFWGKHWPSIKKKVLNRFKFKNGYNIDFFEGERTYLPKNGYTNLFKDLAKNIKIKYNFNFNKFIDPNDFILVICTAPIDEMMDYKFGKLEWLGLDFTFETIKTNGENLLLSPVMNLNTHPKYTRMTEYNQLNVLSRCNGTNRVIGFEKPSKNNKLYPINNVKNMKLLKKYQDYAKKNYPNVYFLGRLSEYQYKNIDMSIQDALNLFKKLKILQNERNI